jgi:hypothetical protein
VIVDERGPVLSRPASFAKRHFRNTAMDSQILLLDLGWVFFATWGMVLLALTAIAFGRDLLTVTRVSKTKVH